MTPREQPSSVQVARQAAVVSAVTRWAGSRRDVRALALLGSWARGCAHAGSDIDLILLVDDPQAYRATPWLDDLGRSSADARCATWRDESYGTVWSRHVVLDDGAEVEFSFAMPHWAAVDPLDPGTRRVLSDGCRVLHDPHELLRRALHAIGS